jgi:hypothetical protein
MTHVVTGYVGTDAYGKCIIIVMIILESGKIHKIFYHLQVNKRQIEAKILQTAKNKRFLRQKNKPKAAYPPPPLVKYCLQACVQNEFLGQKQCKFCHGQLSYGKTQM